MAVSPSSHQKSKPKPMTFAEWVCVTHRATGELVVMGNWLLFVIVTLGLVFSLTIVPLTYALNTPVQTLHLQAMVINHMDMATEQVTPSESVFIDPDWDGTVEGGIMGLHYGQQIPVVGMPLGLALGLWVGHRLDKEI